MCERQNNSGYSVNGSFAEYAIGSADYIGHLPERADFGEIAPILCAGVTTYKAIKEADVQPGDWIAISGVGGLGHIAVQYAKAMGLHVAALDIGEHKLALARQLGADVAVDASAHDAVAQIVKATGGGVHGVVVTAVSPPAFGQALGLVRRKGTVSLVGLPPGNFAIPIFDVVLKRINYPRLDRRHPQGLGRGARIRRRRDENCASPPNSAATAVGPSTCRSRVGRRPFGVKRPKSLFAGSVI